ncbi:MAG TPA: hypothetical protein VLM37_05155 [Fibrobacteraceae bacterium]|nr:hypothetical protein [Fibrobacteraceae bacterium]
MRDLIDSLIQVGLRVEFFIDGAGSPCIRVLPNAANPSDQPLFLCTLTPGTFRESAEEALASFLQTIKKRTKDLD